jgi:perosamine synthetase
MTAVKPLIVSPKVYHAYHLYVVRMDLKRLGVDRSEIFSALRAEGIGVNVHFMPVYLHPFYRRRFGTGPGLCPVAETAYEQIMSLPIYPAMTDQDLADVIAAVERVLSAHHL